MGDNFHDAVIVTPFEQMRSVRVEAFDRVRPSNASWVGCVVGWLGSARAAVAPGTRGTGCLGHRYQARLKWEAVTDVPFAGSPSVASPLGEVKVGSDRARLHQHGP